MSEREYTWFIEPLDSHTNQIIAQELINKDFGRESFCEDGKEHNLWVCPLDFIKFFCKSKKDFNLKFNVYNKRGQGKIRKCKFLFIKPKKKKKTAG